MLLDSGQLTLCTAKDVSKPGAMPVYQLITGNVHLYGERTIGYGRQYAAMGVNEQVDLLARIWQDRSARIGMYALIGEEQYRINNVQHLTDEEGLKVTDLTLRRLDDLYDIAAETEATE